MQSWQRIAQVRPNLLNEWFAMCCLETHERQWMYTLEEMNFTSMQLAYKALAIERALSNVQQRFEHTLQGVDEYAVLMDECDMKTRQIMTTLRERQFMMERWHATKDAPNARSATSGTSTAT